MNNTEMPKVIEIKFEGVDDWGRPIFKQVDSKNRFGSTDKLCYTEEEINSITEQDLTWFGTSFNCEPMGSPAGNIKIVDGKSLLQKAKEGI